jgi:N utilization substance protein B
MAADPPRKISPKPSNRPSLRREGREAALQFLFSRDLNPSMKPEGPAAVAFWNLRTAKPRVREFATELLNGLLPHLPEIDEKIASAADNYAFARLAAVDRNLLRLAVFEILFRDDIPAPVSINEAVEIAKDFGTDESPRFINGVLDRIRKLAETPQKTSTPEP